MELTLNNKLFPSGKLQFWFSFGTRSFSFGIYFYSRSIRKPLVGLVCSFFVYSSKPLRRRRLKNLTQNAKHVHTLALESDLHTVVSNLGKANGTCSFLLGHSEVLMDGKPFDALFWNIGNWIIPCFLFSIIFLRLYTQPPPLPPSSFWVGGNYKILKVKIKWENVS